MAQRYSCFSLVATLGALLWSATPSPQPPGPVAPLQTLVQCVSDMGPPPVALERHFSAHANTVSNVCDMTINLTACYQDGSSCFEYGVPPLRQEVLAAQSAIAQHGGIRFYPCLRGFDAVTESGQRLTRWAATYHCAQEGTADVAPPCAVPDGPVTVIASARPNYPEDAVRYGGFDGTVGVEVVVNADGSIVSTSIPHSSGSPPIDQESLRVAAHSLYAPAVENCQGIPGRYLYFVGYYER